MKQFPNDPELNFWGCFGTLMAILWMACALRPLYGPLLGLSA